MSEKLLIQVIPEPVLLEEWHDSDEEFCICREGDPLHGLCGSELNDCPPLEDDEVPDEITCKECLEIKRQQKGVSHE